VGSHRTLPAGSLS